MVFLDEIDKARAREYDALSSLLSLLESGTARAFRDQSIPWVTLDASRVIWICTANDGDSLPAPILDRLRRFDIPELTKQQSQAVVRSIYLDLRRGVLGAVPSTRVARRYRGPVDRDVAAAYATNFKRRTGASYAQAS